MKASDNIGSFFLLNKRIGNHSRICYFYFMSNFIHFGIAEKMYSEPQNTITKLFEIKYPIIQGGMVWHSGWRLASAVSNNGGLGLIGAGSMYPDILREKLKKNIEVKNAIFEKLYNKPGLDFETIYDEYVEIGKKLKERIVDTELQINQAIDEGQNVLFEGAQALMLDIDFGTYPYVTSSSPTTGGVCVGAGVPPNKLQNLIGVAKAYCTRVGNGPFVTEDFEEAGATMAKVGHEFGAVTGRPRRCGWLDLVALRHACMINGITHLVITKLDVLQGFDKIKVCTAYKTEDGEIIDYFTSSTTKLAKYTPIYEELEGFNEDITKFSRFEELPQTAQDYIKFIEDYLGIGVYLVSVGPDRSQNIIRKELF